MMGTGMQRTLCLAAAVWASLVSGVPQQQQDELQSCGDSMYSASEYTCYDNSTLCPIINGQSTLSCGDSCYLPSLYSCTNDSIGPACSSPATTIYLSDPPYSNYFYSDCHLDVQVVVTSPLPTSNFTIIGPRVIFAWPAGNSGIATFFAPQNGINGSLALELQNSSSTGQALSPVYIPATNGAANQNASVGVTAQLTFNDSATLTIPILGSVRTIRDFTEGPSLLQPQIQDAIQFNQTSDGGVVLSRMWLDNLTTTTLSFAPTATNGTAGKVTLSNKTVSFESGTYTISAYFNYPQLDQLSQQEVLANTSQALISQQSDETTSLSFLSYTTKLLAGAWRFLTYFGRDTMIASFLLGPVLSEGKGGALEAVLGAVLDRINQTDGSVCHEETIGDYATWLNLQDNITSTAASCSYIMIDSDFYLPVLMQQYFLESSIGQSRKGVFLNTTANSDFGNGNMTYADLALTNAERIMDLAQPFATNQTQDNLVHIKAGQIVGDWRDSTYGIGGATIPYDVNTALVPAALRSIAALSSAGFFPSHPDWNTTASLYAQVFEDSTLQFFEVTLSPTEANSRISTYINASSYIGPTSAPTINSSLTFHALGLDGYNSQTQVAVLNSDDGLRHFLLNTTNQTQLTSFVNQTATHILTPFPAGLLTPLGILVANPAYGPSPVYAANWTTGAYHGTVIWSWNSMAMMARGLERQLGRCMAGGDTPAFCNDTSVYSNVKQAYNTLWDTIEANEEHLEEEVWSWTYADGSYSYEPLGNISPPDGTNPTESDIRQLWSLTFLAVTRNEALR